MLDKILYLKYVKDLFKLAIPMIVGNLGVILIGAGDVLVAARYSTDTLAAISIANSIVSTIFLFGMGLLVGISPLLSNYRGEKTQVKKYFLPTIFFSLIISIFTTILIISLIPTIEHLGFDKTLIPNIKNYMFICAFSTFGAYLQIALKEYLQSYEIVILPNVLNIINVFVHLFLDFALVFGLCGFPAMGIIGLAIATVISRTLFGAILLVYCIVNLRIKIFNDNSYYRKLLKIGFPIATAMLLEVFAFNLITILIGRMSGIYAAAHNILLTISTATFMIPVAISNAIAVKVGFANGAQNYKELKRYSISGIILSVSIMAFFAIFFLSTPQSFVEIFTRDNSLIQLCTPIVILMGLFQIFDGLQVSLGGVFKGIKKTNIVMIGNFIAYWIIGIPLGSLLAFNFKMKLFGFWIGLTLSIFLLSIYLLAILIKELRKRADETSTLSLDNNLPLN